MNPQSRVPRAGPSPPLSYTLRAATEPPPVWDRGKTGASLPARLRPVNGAPLLLFRQEKCRIYALNPAEPHIVMAILTAG
ncbi:hypothetical protein NDU88_002821 [Pleurodeles waltl]|uniref:Uncharacterized protein n=1 Tax=Pleurodeles waltl TaxID=8319 RepID=A0AAV7LJW0_PLEWA|nr:hypothetical protein NDU88_002821 [Pleurodeles waltl]